MIISAVISPLYIAVVAIWPYKGATRKNNEKKCAGAPRGVGNDRRHRSLLEVFVDLGTSRERTQQGACRVFISLPVRRDQDGRSKSKMSRFLQEEAILDVLEAEYESSYSETEDVENVSIHETDSEEDADLYDHQSHELPLPPLAQPLGVRNWRDLQVSHDYLEDIPLQFLRRGEFTGKDNITKWQVCTPPQNVRTRAHNIVLTILYWKSPGCTFEH
ncbi:hypothetical protein ACJJTC_004499 [Scirpophaga incertulas]